MKKLFESFKIRNTEIKNRIAVPPMVCYKWSDENGYVSEKHIEHYKELSKGGFGLIIQEATCINKNSRLSNDQLGIWSDEHIEGLKKITDIVHKNNCPIFVQIHSAGVVGVGNECPSEYNFKTKDGKIKKGIQMKIDEIECMINDFIQAGIRAFKAGYDGVEVHGCHSYILSQFLNKRVNKRDDIYGKNPENIIFNIMEGIRNKTSNDFIIGIRLGGFEPKLFDAVNYAKKLDNKGIDFIDVSYGFNAESEPFKPDSFKYKDIIYAAYEIKKAVKCPVFAVNGINSVSLAESIISDTNVNMVDIGRCSLVNPNWANDAYNGSDTGKCFYCPDCMWRIDYTKCPGRKAYIKSKI